jgi:hypothetical protein
MGSADMAGDLVDFIKEAVNRMESYTLRFLTPIIAVEGPRSGRHVGSGFYCMASGRPSLATAWHVIEEARSHPSGTVGISMPRDHEGRREPIPVGFNVVVSPEVLKWDVGVFPLPDDFPMIDPECLWPEDRIVEDPEELDRDYLFFNGYPKLRSSNRSAIPGGGPISYRPLGYGTMRRLAEDEGGLPSDLGDFEFAMNFGIDPEWEPEPADRALFEREDGPSGFSGSPVWRLGLSGRSRAEWEPERHARLAGVVTKHVLERRLVCATHARELYHAEPTTRRA